MIATIAIIDDDDAVRDSTRMVLECNDYAVREHASAEDFLSQPKDGVDCMVVDHHMPGMTGLALLERLQTDGHRIPALMMTGQPDISLEPRLTRLGVKVLHKPVDEKELLRSIEQARQKRAISED